MSYRDQALDAGLHIDGGMTLDEAAAHLEQGDREQQKREWFMFEGSSLDGRCGHCQRRVDNHDDLHRVTSISRGGKGVECLLRGDIEAWQAQPLGPRP